VLAHLPIHWRNFSLHTMLLWLVALTLGPVIGLTIWGHLEDRQNERRQAVLNAAQAAGMVAQSLAQETQNARLFLDVLARNPEVRSCDRSRCDAVMQATAQAATQYDLVMVLGPGGKVLATSRPLPPRTNMATNPAVAEAFKGQVFSVGTTREGAGSYVTYAVPVTGTKGKTTIVLAAQVSLTRLAQMFLMAGLPSNTSLVVAGTDGRVHYRLPEDKSYLGALLPQEHRQIILDQAMSAEGWATGLDGRERYYVLRRLQFCQEDVCYVRVGIPKDAVYAESDTTLRRNLAGLLCITLLTLYLSRQWGARHILRPVEKLRDTVQRLGAGDLTVRTGINDGHSYLSEVARTFDHMAETVERQQAEQETARQALFLSERRLKAVFNASADGMLLLSPEGVILSMNDCAAARRQHTPDELEGMNMLDLLPWELRENRRQQYVEVTNKARPLRFEEVREGRTYAIRLYPITGEDGQVRQIASFSRDITERKLGELALLAAKEAAEAASKTKSDFLANMSHELRTPLNGVMGMLQLLKNTEPTKEQDEYLNWATQSAQLLSELLGDVLDYAALDSDSLKLDHRRFTTQEVITPLQADFSPGQRPRGSPSPFPQHGKCWSCLSWATQQCSAPSCARFSPTPSNSPRLAALTSLFDKLPPPAAMRPWPLP